MYKASKNNVIQTTAKAALTQATSTLYQRMESTMKQASLNKQNNEESNSVLQGLVEENELIKSRNEEIEVILKNYMGNTVKNIVDNVCLYEEKTKTIQKKYDENSDPQKKPEDLQKELSLIPLRSVPLINETDDVKYKKIMTVNIENEMNIASGKFGWCIVCRKSANVYCKDSRVPVCNAECKKKHLDELSVVNSLFGVNHHRKENQFLEDSIEVFKMFSKLSSKDSVK